MNANHERRDGDVELSAEQRLQSLLCADVLGEASAEESAEVEAALKNSAELRAEKARLEVAVPIVAGVLKERAGEALSPQSKSELDAAVARRARPAFFNQPLVRLAAGVAIVASGYAIYRQNEGPASERQPGKLELAQAPGKKAEGRVGGADSADGAKFVERTQLDGSAAAGSPPADSKNEARPAGAVSKEQAPAQSEPTPSGPTPAADGAWAGASSPSTPKQHELGVFEITGGTLQDLDEARKVKQLEEQAASGLPTTQAAPKASSSVGLVVGTPVVSPAPGAPHEGGVSSSVLGLGGGAGGRFAGRAGASGPSTPGLASGSAPSRPAERASELRALGYLSESNTAASSDDFFLGKGESRGGEAEPAADAPFAGRFKDIRRDEFTEQARLHQRYLHIHDHCVMPIGPIRPRDMFFRYWGDNPFELALLDRQSTFSIDVDTASYALARRYLVAGQLPTKEQIRTEEFVNYFKGDVRPPSEGTFAVATEFAPSLFGDDSNTWMLRVAVRGKEVSKAERQPVALTFVVDVSGSMREGARLELVKHSLRLLVSQMDASDSISLVKFSNDAALILPMTSARQKDLIESAIHPLQPEGSTNTEAGLRMGYEQALAALTPRANNRVVLLTDGVANVGITDPGALVQMVERQRKAGIYLNTVGVGMNNHNDNLLEQLANKGDGLCNYVDDEQEVRRALVDNFTGAFQVIARDVKVQVEFDPAQVERYRLLGYENRAIADADFRNDKVDAGEVGAGHQVVALYEIVRRNVTGDGPLATVRLRWKPPFQAGVPENEQGAAQELAQPVHAAQSAASYVATTAGYRRSVLVAQFAEFLRRSVHARRDSLERMIDEARKLSSEMRGAAGGLSDAEFDEFIDMATRSRELIQAELARRDWLDDCGHLLRHRHYLHGQLDELRRRFPRPFDDPRLAAEFETQLTELQTRLGELEARVAGERGAADAEMVQRLEAENIALQRRLIELLERARVEQSGK